MGRCHQRMPFPPYLLLCGKKEAWVRDCWSDLEEGEGWNPLFTRHFCEEK